MKFLLFLAAFLLAFSPCFALSDAEYRQMRSSSPEFKQADRELGAIWRRIMKLAKGSHRQNLLEDQREWVSWGRDESAREFMATGLVRTSAYTRATIKRVHQLQAVEHNLKLSPRDQGRGRSVKADSFYETEEDDPSSSAR